MPALSETSAGEDGVEAAACGKTVKARAAEFRFVHEQIALLGGGEHAVDDLGLAFVVGGDVLVVDAEGGDERARQVEPAELFKRDRIAG